MFLHSWVPIPQELEDHPAILCDVIPQRRCKQVWQNHMFIYSELSHKKRILSCLKRSHHENQRFLLKIKCRRGQQRCQTFWVHSGEKSVVLISSWYNQHTIILFCQLANQCFFECLWTFHIFETRRNPVLIIPVCDKFMFMVDWIGTQGQIRCDGIHGHDPWPPLPLQMNLKTPRGPDPMNLSSWT